jgi:putative membrane protein
METRLGDESRNEDSLSVPGALMSGLLMGAADAVPGVSGGTIALILGIYERFIGALAAAVRLPWTLWSSAGRRSLGPALRLLLPLGVGVAIAYYLATKLLVGRADEVGLIQDPDTAPMCYGFFFGLVLISLREPWRRIRNHGFAVVFTAMLGGLAAAVFTGLPYANEAPATWMLLYGGALAICVMLLPGVSGSLMLVILGQYQAVVEAVHDRDLPRILVFLTGLILGVALFVPFLRRLLARHHDLTMAALTGLMAGSLRALWPWKANYDPKVAPMTNEFPDGDVASLLAVAAAMLVGGGVILLLARIEARLRPGT